MDLSISYPLVEETFSIVTVGLISLAAPAIIMAVICLVVVPGPNGGRPLNTPHALRRKLWELYAALTGIALSVALGFFVTQGLKKAFGKPRPHLLAICDPDLDNIRAHVVGNYAQDFDIRWTLVDASICRIANRKDLSDSFQSFPSGHCSFAWSGLLYFSLFLCAKFSFTIPYLPLHRVVSLQQPPTQLPEEKGILPLTHPYATSTVASASAATQQGPSSAVEAQKPIYNQSAAPPLYGMLLVLFPIGVATFVAATRYSNYFHDGFDITAGSLIGIVSAIISFRWYHLPIRRGQGWAWAPRSKNRAFGVGVGVQSYAGPEGWQTGAAVAPNG